MSVYAGMTDAELDEELIALQNQKDVLVQDMKDVAREQARRVAQIEAGRVIGVNGIDAESRVQGQ